MRIAIFGQAPFGRDVAVALADGGHEIAAVYVPPDSGRPDPLAAEADARGWPLLRCARFRRRGEAIPEVVGAYRTLAVELNVMPFTTVILPPEIVDAPRHGSLCFHPSKLPAYRGGSAIAWQIILGAGETAATVFRPDAGVDTGPIVVQHAGIPIGPRDTAASLYFDKLYPAGVAAMLEAVDAVAAGTATFTPQSDEGASHQPLLTDVHARIDWTRPGVEVDRLVRGCDPNPGAWAQARGTVVRLFGAVYEPAPGAPAPGTLQGVDDAGRLRIAVRGGVLSVAKLRIADSAKEPAAQALRTSGLDAGNDRLD